MKKSKLILIPLLTIGALVGCDKTETPAEEYKFLTFADGECSVLPDLGSVNQNLEGEITVAIVYEGREVGWKAVAAEYEKIHKGAITVNIDTGYPTNDTYIQKLSAELGKTDPTWSIIQGNLMPASASKSAKTVGLSSSFYDTNPYAANKKWYKVLETDAYVTDKTGASNETYILNTENLQTAWFVNKVALNAAAQNGYDKKVGGEVANPETWDELVSLCAAMKEAGYSNPLGLSLDKASITASQFSWLLRVYGDFYTRDLYNFVSQSYPEYTVDLKSKNPEGEGFVYSNERLFNTILQDADNDAHYFGAKSSRFADFIRQLGKLAGYCNPNAYQKSFEETRNAFQTQANNDAPQIMLDYAGNGLKFMKAENNNFKIDFFDHPVMTNTSLEDDGRILRDVGGNGGYLSVLQNSANRSKETISIDFMKFFMSPYGQSVYYQALSSQATPVYPQGITLVKNENVVIPQEWKTYFSTNKISFNGLADSNPYLTYLIRGMGNNEATQTIIPSLWSDIMLSKYDFSDNATLKNNFQTPWHNALKTDWETVAAVDKKVSNDCYEDVVWDA